MVVYTGTNATGWNLLMNGSIVLAVFTMYDTAFLGWSIALLFFVHQIILYMKARSLTLNFIMGSFFVSMYIAAESISIFPVLKEQSINLMVLLLILQLGSILYYAFWR